MFAQTGLHGDFLKLKETRALFRGEQHFPFAVIDRGGPRLDGSVLDMLHPARDRADELVAAYRRPEIPPDREQAMLAFADDQSRTGGLETLPGIDRHRSQAELGQ